MSVQSAGYRNKMPTSSSNHMRLIAVTAAVLCLFLSMAFAQEPSAKKKFTFHGKVEKVDGSAQTLTVRSAKIEGWNDAATVSYTVDNAEIFRTVQSGDEITAKVYEGDLSTLHDIKID